MNNDSTNLKEVRCESMGLCDRPVHFRVEGKLLCARCAMDYVNYQLTKSPLLPDSVQETLKTTEQRIITLEKELRESRARDGF